MNTWTWLLLPVVALGAAALILFTTRYLRLRGTRVVTCPETGRPVGVELDTGHAARTGIVSATDLRLTDCTRWPERAGCGQECLSQIEEAPHDCLARAILARWYADRECVYCGAPFGEIRWHEHRPALLDPDDGIREWDDIPPETIPDVLRTHRPVCWSCAIAEGFRATHADRVVDRTRNEG